MSKTFLFQTIQFSTNTQFSSIWVIDRTLSGTTTQGQSGPGSNGNKRVLCIPKSSSITDASQSYCLVSYTGHSLGESYPSAKMQSVWSTTPADRAISLFLFKTYIKMWGQFNKLYRADRNTFHILNCQLCSTIELKPVEIVAPSR